MFSYILLRAWPIVWPHTRVLSVNLLRYSRSTRTSSRPLSSPRAGHGQIQASPPSRAAHASSSPSGETKTQDQPRPNERTNGRRGARASGQTCRQISVMHGLHITDYYILYINLSHAIWMVDHWQMTSQFCSRTHRETEWGEGGEAAHRGTRRGRTIVSDVRRAGVPRLDLLACARRPLIAMHD